MKVYGPYTRKDGRQHVVLVEGDCKRTVSYPKYLMEKHLGRELNDNETVDHTNRDFTDNRIENLQILERSPHSKLDVTRAHLVEITCVLCKKVVYKKGSTLRHNSKQGKAGPFCSRACAGKYGKEIQMGSTQKLDTQPSPETDK